MLVKKIIGFELGNDVMIQYLRKHSYYYFLFLVFFLGPLIETLLFQILVIRIVVYLTKNEYLAMFISALVFGINHIYSLPYFIYAFVGGVLLANQYFEARKYNLKPIYVIFITHVLINISITVLHPLFD